MPIDDLIRPNAFRDDLHSSYFLTIGRALAVAQHFENVCRAVADFLEVKRAVFSEKVSPADEGFAAFVEGIRKRMLGGAVKKIGSLPGIPADLNSIFDTAKDARNRIAHDCTISAFHPLAEEEAMWASLESLLVDIRSIAEADMIACAFLYSMNEHEPLLVPRDYVQNVTDWVFEEFQGEDFVEAHRNGEQAGGDQLATPA